jgi:hypothetical protein
MSSNSNHVTGVQSQATGQQEVKPEDSKPQVIPSPAQPQPQQQKIQAPEAGQPIPPTPGTASSEAGLDIGTMNIISSRQVNGSVQTKRIRDVFTELSADKVKMLKLNSNVSYVERDGSYFVLGDDAAAMSNIFPKEIKLRAPMHKGVIAAGELEAMEMLKIMVGNVLGRSPQGGVCFVSSPGDPVDDAFDALYHEAVVTDIVESYGWEVHTASESTAMAYSECADTMFTGLCISCGHGMTNVSLVFRTVETLKFSCARGGSWIDEQAAKVTGKTPSQICAIKEKGLDLLNPQGREQNALVVYYKHLIKYAIHHFIQRFRELSGDIELPEDIPCVVAGGTSKPAGFIELVKQEINKNKGFPFPISEVKHADDPLNSVSKGLLVMAQNYNR